MGSLRIVGGTLRGRRIPVPDAPGLRPTPDKVREAVFNILGQRFDGGRVLDAYAGTGALGFEALSRGAAAVVFVDSDRDVVRALTATADALGVAGKVNVIREDVVPWAARGGDGGRFDLVLADPPYADDAGTALLSALVGGDILAEGARIVVERAAPGAPPKCPPKLKLLRTAVYGGTAMEFLMAVGDPGKEFS